MIKQLQKKNKDFTVYDIHDARFSAYGRVLSSKSYQNAMRYLQEKTKVPTQGNTYIAHDDAFAELFEDVDLNSIFQGQKLEYGYVCGHNQKLNALEYHKSAEVNIALTPLVLMLGLKKDVIHQRYDSQKVCVFYLPAGTVIELYPEVLHFSPCEVMESGFTCGVILPYGTNMEFVKKKERVSTDEDLLFKTNKWLLCHEEFTRFVELGAHVGLVGQNYKMNY
jgi:hypothetical protein